MLQWHRGSEAQQATHTCSLYLFLQMRTSSHTKQEPWNAPARKEPSSFPQSGFDQHANVCSAVALRKVYIKLGKQCRRTKSCQAHDGAVWCGSTCSEEQGQQIQGTPPTNDTSPRSFLSHRPWCKFKKSSPALQRAAHAATRVTMFVPRQAYDLRK